MPERLDRLPSCCPQRGMIVQPQVAGEEDDRGLHCRQASGEPESVSIEHFSALATASDTVTDSRSPLGHAAEDSVLVCSERGAG